jgi:hypothetical protein
MEIKTALAISLMILAACEYETAEERYEAGYDDGYAAGYNTTCQIRPTLIRGDWEDDKYTAGHTAGYTAGSNACVLERQRQQQ